MNNVTDTSNVERCWNVIGIAGDRSCYQLSNVTHCRNCPVYSMAGRHLLERSIMENYRSEWTELLAETTTSRKESLESPAATLRVVIFRLQREWLALPAQVFRETTPPGVIHTIPHRSNEILQGLVSIRGELQLCFSLSHLLNLETADASVPALSPVVYPRMVVVEKAGNVWVFAVDELYGVHRLPENELRGDSKSMTQARQTYTRGLFQWQSRSVSYLDDELLFHSLGKKVMP